MKKKSSPNFFQGPFRPQKISGPLSLPWALWVNPIEKYLNSIISICGNFSKPNGVTGGGGGGAGGKSAPRDFWSGIFCLLIRKKEGSENWEEKKENCKREGGAEVEIGRIKNFKGPFLHQLPHKCLWAVPRLFYLVRPMCEQKFGVSKHFGFYLKGLGIGNRDRIYQIICLLLWKVYFQFG